MNEQDDKQKNKQCSAQLMDDSKSRHASSASQVSGAGPDMGKFMQASQGEHGVSKGCWWEGEAQGNRGRDVPLKTPVQRICTLGKEEYEM